MENMRKGRTSCAVRDYGARAKTDFRSVACRASQGISEAWLDLPGKGPSERSAAQTRHQALRKHHHVFAAKETLDVFRQ